MELTAVGKGAFGKQTAEGHGGSEES